MNTLSSLKTRGQESMAHLVNAGKQQPTEVQTWGVTALAAATGALAVAATAKGILAVVSVLAYPPVALTAGALAGGALGWGYMQRRAGQSPAQDEQTGQTAEAVEADFSIPDGVTVEQLA